MLDTRLTDEQRSLVQTVEAFARAVVAPAGAQHDRERTFPYEAVAFRIARMQARPRGPGGALRRGREDARRPAVQEGGGDRQARRGGSGDGQRPRRTQVHGGYGFRTSTSSRGTTATVKVLEVGEGTTEVQLMLIARELGL